MKLKRHKKFQRHIGFYVKNFRFKPPFHILVDGTFAKAALDNKVNLRDQLPKYLDAQIKLLTTPCVLIETEKLGPELYGAVQILKSVALIKCPHGAHPLDAPKCITSIAKAMNTKSCFPEAHPSSSKSAGDAEEEKQRYIVATQDNNLRAILRKTAGVPLISLFRAAPALEKPSLTNLQFAESKAVQQLEVLTYQKEILNNMKQEVFGVSSTPERKGTKKRKRTGPNPLSCKKSKKGKKKVGRPPTSGRTKPGSGSELEVPVKKKRRRKKIARHVKDELSSSTG